MVTLDNWYIYGTRVVGDLESGKRVRTSTIVSRDGDVVCTKSGSAYKLLKISDEHERTREEIYVELDKELASE